MQSLQTVKRVERLARGEDIGVERGDGFAERGIRCERGRQRPGVVRRCRVPGRRGSACEEVGLRLARDPLGLEVLERAARVAQQRRRHAGEARHLHAVAAARRAGLDLVQEGDLVGIAALDGGDVDVERALVLEREVGELEVVGREQRERAKNVHVSAVETGESNDITFLHEIEAGPASRSYGVQVARLAGMPPALLRHARNALEHLEAERIARQPQIDLFAGAAASAGEAGTADGTEKHATAAVANSALGEAVAALDPDILTPREALDALYRLKALHRDTS